MEHFRGCSYRLLQSPVLLPELGSFTSYFLVLCPTTRKRELNRDWSSWGWNVRVPEHRELKEKGKLINPSDWNPQIQIFFFTSVCWQLEPMSSPRMTTKRKLGTKMREENLSSVFLLKLVADATWESREIKEANMRCQGREERREHFSNPWIWQPLYMK